MYQRKKREKEKDNLVVFLKDMILPMPVETLLINQSHQDN